MSAVSAEKEIYRKIQAKHGRKGGKAVFAKIGKKGMRKLSKLAARKRQTLGKEKRAV